MPNNLDILLEVTTLPEQTLEDVQAYAPIRGAAGADGEDGQEVTLRVLSQVLQWKYVSDPSYTNLIDFTTLTLAATQITQDTSNRFVTDTEKTTWNAKQAALTFPITVANGGSGVATLTGILKGNGTSAFTAAIAGTDYIAGGVGTANYFPVFSGSGVLINSLLNQYNGNLGFGTATPTHDLTVEYSSGGSSADWSDFPSIKISNTNTSGYSFSAVRLDANNGTVAGGFFIDGLGNSSGIGGSDAGLLFQSRTNHLIAFGTNDTERMRITNDGKVIVNSFTNSGYQFDVNGTGRFTGALTIGSTTASTSTTTGALVVAGGVGIGGTINVGGKIGIGIAPTYGIHLQSSDDATALLFVDRIGGARFFMQAYLDGVYMGANSYHPVFFRTNNTTQMTLTSYGFLGIGLTPTAILHLKAGTATANTAPLKLTAGTSLTTPENGAIEFDGTNIYITVGGVRKTFTIT